MSSKIKQKTKTRLQLFLCALGYILLQVAISGSALMGFPVYNGVLMACQFAMCLLMVRADHKLGFKIAIGFMAYSFIAMVIVMFVQNTTGPLPGIGNTIIYAITLTALSRQFKIRDRDAITDYVTGIRNNRGLSRLIHYRIGNAQPFHLLHFNLENFKTLSNQHGSAYADQLLRQVGQRITDHIEENGQLFLVNGSEFVVLLKPECDAEMTANQLLFRLQECFTIQLSNTSIDTFLAVYAGIVSYPVHGRSHDTLLKRADIAMFEATRKKLPVACLYTEDVENKIERELELEGLIKEGLQKDFFYLVYQPQYQINDKKLRGFETLLRMRLPNGTHVSPSEFIPIAEKSDLILRIDEYVLHRAMTEFKRLLRESREDLLLSVNVSAKNISDIFFVDKVTDVLAETGFSPTNLEIEITEYSMVQSLPTTVENITRLRQMGIRVALDDFGTGYTSLSYLSKMPISLLKIDKSLIDSIERTNKDREFVNAIISMGHLMGCQVIAEGVENNNQLDLLAQQQCDNVQGFVLSRPLDYNSARELARRA